MRPTVLNGKEAIAAYFGFPEQVIPEMERRFPDCPLVKSGSEYTANVRKMEEFLKSKRAEAESQGGATRFPQAVYRRTNTF